MIKSDRYSWKAIKSQNIKVTALQGIYRAIKLRFSSKSNNIFQLNLKLDEKIAKAAAQKIPLETTHLVISQNLLPFIYKTGVLGGRTFDVLMTRLPIYGLNSRLNFAHSRHLESSTLNDFRASNELELIEKEALKKARKIITPHTEIASLFSDKVQKLDWQLPIQNDINSKGNKILFPAYALGKKGAYEIKQLAQELNLVLVVSGSKMENLIFWEDVKIEKFDGNFNEIGLVIYPTYIEHQPRQVLKAISMGIPVITTTACGIDVSDKVKIVELGNYKQLKDEVLNSKMII